MAAREWISLGNFYMTPGYATEFMYCFLARDLYPSPLDPDADEFLNLEKVPLEQFKRMLVDGLIPDSKTLAVYALAQPYLPGK